MKTTKAELQKRIDIMVSLRIKGYSPSESIQMAKQLWNVSERTIKRYLAKAKKQINYAGGMNFEEHTGILRSRLDFLFNEAIGEKNFELARRIVKEDIKVLDARKKFPYTVLPVDAVDPTYENKPGSEQAAMVEKMDALRKELGI